MDKEVEDANIVSYKFCINVFVEATSAIEKKQGVGIFNKNDITFTLIPEQTDSYFFDNRYEIPAMHAKLIKLFRDKKMFPDTLDIATG